MYKHQRPSRKDKAKEKTDRNKIVKPSFSFALPKDNSFNECCLTHAKRSLRLISHVTKRERRFFTFKEMNHERERERDPLIFPGKWSNDKKAYTIKIGNRTYARGQKLTRSIFSYSSRISRLTSIFLYLIRTSSLRWPVFSNGNSIIIQRGRYAFRFPGRTEEREIIYSVRALKLASNVFRFASASNFQTNSAVARFIRTLAFFNATLDK